MIHLRQYFMSKLFFAVFSFGLGVVFWGIGYEVSYVFATESSSRVLPETSESGNTPGVRILLVAKEEAIISARFFGTITHIRVKEGEKFQKNAKLVSFDCNELAADRAVADATLKLQKTTSRANEELHAQQVVGDLENDLSRIRVEEAAARSKAYSTRMRNCSIIAPFAGQVVRLEANEYESLQPGTPIMLIQNPKLLAAELHVPSSWLRWLEPGISFHAYIEETGRSYQAEVDHIGVRVDPVSRTIKVYATISGAHKELLPGMSGYAEFAVPAQPQRPEPPSAEGKSVDKAS